MCTELCIGGTRIATDESWQARESCIRFSGVYDGETQDLTAETAPLTPCAVAFDGNVLTPQICEPVRTTQRISPVRSFVTSAGEFVYDFGQNLAGVVEVRTPSDFDGTLKLQFVEILVNGNFYTKNLRSAKATDVFTIRGRERSLRNLRSMVFAI